MRAPPLPCCIHTQSSCSCAAGAVLTSDRTFAPCAPIRQATQPVRTIMLTNDTSATLRPANMQERQSGRLPLQPCIARRTTMHSHARSDAMHRHCVILCSSFQWQVATTTARRTGVHLGARQSRAARPWPPTQRRGGFSPGTPPTLRRRPTALRRPSAARPLPRPPSPSLPPPLTPPAGLPPSQVEALIGTRVSRLAAPC